MKPIASAVALCFLFVIVGQAQTKPAPSLQPTPLEAFARQPATHIAWSKEIGRFDSSEAHAVVTALILEDTAHFAPHSEGVSLSALKKAEFRFPKQDPSQFSAAIALAIDQLKGH
jgi:hypothetical protein